MNVKPVKIFECSCANDFTGDFCEFKTEQNQLVYINDINGFVFNDEGQRIETRFTINNNAQAESSCFTMLNGEAVIFGSFRDNNERQVTILN